MTGLYETVFIAAKAVVGVSIALGATGLVAGLLHRPGHTPAYDGFVDRRSGVPDRRVASIPK
ncbi:MAG TPA: hypothetical protein VHG08_16830 [Longimicrobium sp.]|nr:hypothetical protein [Longimicrobium sp.]